jgi:hypothetical protein
MAGRTQRKAAGEEHGEAEYLKSLTSDRSWHLTATDKMDDLDFVAFRDRDALPIGPSNNVSVQFDSDPL